MRIKLFFLQLIILLFGFIHPNAAGSNINSIFSISFQPEPKQKGKLKNGQKHGFWIYYNDSGWIDKREKWKEGKLEYTLYFNKNHKKTKWVYANGKEKIYKTCNCSN
ncbi:MAG: hypothetical protein ACK4K9_08555 [Bacteroidia bacterium]